MKKIISFIAGMLCFWQLSAQQPNTNVRYDSYNGLVMAGYQGWFAAEGCESNRGWYHYGFRDGNASIDFWPDMTEYTKKYVAPFKMADGTDAYLFSSYDEETVDLHFRWMKEYGIDGVFMQRFVGELKRPAGKRHFNKVLESALKAARKYGRAIGVMYDLSGCQPEDMKVLENDWKELQSLYALSDRDKNPTYIWHNGSPLLTVWGVGFNDNRKYSIDDAHQMIARVKKDNKVSIMLGVPYYWRLLDKDTENNPALHTLIQKHVDIVMPWAVGRYNHQTYDSIAAGLSGDIRWCRDNKVDYVPLVFPGFSWGNLRNNPSIYNQIPRLQGDFLWRQVATAKTAGASSLYVAMFDEIDEGTAIFKCAVDGKLPLFGEKRFVGIEHGLSSDYYLWLVGEATKWFHGANGYSVRKPARSHAFEAQENPIFRHIYTADASAHVWADGRLYVYPSQDIYPARGCDLMDRYHVFSTDDMVNWIDHGEILNSNQVSWGRPEGGFMWAPDCAYKDGTYYFYFPHPSGTNWNNTWKIGVATSKSPVKDFTVQGYFAALDSFAMIDPSVFVDDDGQAYFYYGGGSRCKAGKLKANMMELDGPLQDMTGLEDFHEAAWVHKRNGIYYLSYSDNNRGANRMRYATSKSPLGPWTSQGIYMDATNCDTNHGSIVEFKGQWYAFYHNSVLSGRGNLRSVCVEKLFYNADGTIQKVEQTGMKPKPKN